MRTRWLFAASGALLVLSSGLTVAASPITDAQERFVEGNRLMKAGDYDGARVAYEQSLALVPHGSTYRNLALAEFKLGDPVKALKHLRSALKSPDLQPDRRSVTKHDLDEAYAATGHVEVSTSPGASIRVDGMDVDGTAPLPDPVDVTAGHHTIEAHVGGRSAKADVDAKAGIIVKVDISLAEPVPTPATTPPPATTEVPASPAPTSTNAALPDLPSSAESRPYWIPRREIGLVAAGAGVVAIGIGVYFFSQAASEQNRAGTLVTGVQPGACTSAAPPSGCSAQQQARSSQQSDATASRVLIGVGSAVIVAAAAIVLWPDSSSSRTALQPLVSPYGGGLQLQGEF
jgi:tetratricopeptide (TPR) repeat protein